MQKKVLKSIVGPLIGLCFFYCSSLDDYTGLGSNIVKDSDPALMNFGDNFFPLALDSADVIDTSVSLPGKSSPEFGEHRGKLAAGTSGGTNAYGYVEFAVNYDFAKKLDTNCVFDSIVCVFDTLVDTLHSNTDTAAPQLKVYRCTKANAGSQTMPDTSVKALCTLKDSTGTHWRGTLDSIFADSIFNQCLASIICYNDTGTKGTSDQKIFHCDSILPSRFFISLFNTGNSIRWFKNDLAHRPALVFHTHYTDHRPNGDTIVIKVDTLRGYPSFVVTEDASLVTVKSAQAISSWLSGRISLFKLDLKPLWDTMQATGFHELLSAGFAAQPNRLISKNSNDTITYFLSDKYYSDTASINEQFVLAQKTYGSVVKLKEASDTTDSDTTDIVIPIDYHLQHFLDGRQREFYLYIRLVSSEAIWNQEILWSQPRFKAVLTTIN